MHDIDQHLTNVRQAIVDSANASGRDAKSIQLLAVSKTQSPDSIMKAYQCGQHAFGENYLQEALDKQQTLAKMAPEAVIEWHFIGPIQSNKTREIAENFSWVHSVDRLKIATRLNNQRPATLPPLNICLQVNIDNEASKAGVTLAELPALANAIQALPHLTLRGLMAIPAKRDHYDDQYAVHKQLQQAQSHLQLHNPNLVLDTLSMGMSDDLEAAIAAGATMVRIGSGIFGARPSPAVITS